MTIFHTYGLIIGAAIVVAMTLVEKQYEKLGYSEDCFWKIMLAGLIFGVVGARIWHVATDFYLYENNLREVFYIWSGGLSIFGGVLGGIAGFYFALKLVVGCTQKNIEIQVGRKFALLELLDVAVFGLPFGQAIGRLGNYVNQELYGRPTSFFLKIFIDKEHRLVGFKDMEFYHPLFFYEIVFMLAFGFLIHYLNNKKKLPKIGTGKLFLIYVLYYSIVRFFLDFIRLDKVLFMNTLLSTNQIFLFLVIMIIFFSKKNRKT